MTALALATRAPWPRSAGQWLHIGVTGLLVHGVYLGGVFIAISHGLPAGITSLVVGLQPLLTALGAGWLLGEQVRPRQWLGLVLGFGGVTLVVGSKLGGVAASDFGAMLLPALLALLGITVGTLYQKRYCPSFDLRTGSVIQFVPTLLLTAAVARATETMQITWSGEFMFALLWLVLVLFGRHVRLRSASVEQPRGSYEAKFADARRIAIEEMEEAAQNWRQRGDRHRRRPVLDNGMLMVARQSREDFDTRAHVVTRILGLDPGLRITEASARGTSSATSCAYVASGCIDGDGEPPWPPQDPAHGVRDRRYLPP